ncbi:hypothetical protein [Pseudolactococcus carnosus]|uniref:hypothetical protein n=1 Tax=Pseudolactococcus carnosus TaxID=2749961 RepID=UPI0011799137|nr:hypothetical protein [Lactococcus carnosus]MCJ1969501.1 hypothetical protein [Lactococcus carnosus]MCJ1972649.1 hypothetical protein [Lactococcus carnosus]MCJ1982486.1 hypothetical protein [Lactococcus carnosus]MCJ1987731.1 hypothetical protein [Lactococcus carnosus]MCJ1991445.1 hypothetical protein [Lactococcus carnosus]
MTIQTELFEDKSIQIVVRCKESFKNEVNALAKDNKLKLLSYIKYLLTQELKKEKKLDSLIAEWLLFLEKFLK